MYVAQQMSKKSPRLVKSSELSKDYGNVSMKLHLQNQECLLESNGGWECNSGILAEKCKVIIFIRTEHTSLPISKKLSILCDKSYKPMENQISKEKNI